MDGKRDRPIIDLARERLLTLEAAAERLQVSRAPVYAWITRGASVGG